MSSDSSDAVNSAETDLTECIFLDIPSEIRVLVYQFLFDLDLWRIPRLSGCYNDAAGCCDLQLYDGQIYTRKRGWKPTAFNNFAAIVRSCRLTYKESLPVLYDQTVFYVRVSDEQYARTMRPYAPLSECIFMPLVKQIKISVDARTHNMLLEMPDAIEKLAERLSSSSQPKLVVEFAVSNGSLSGLPPIGNMPMGMLMEDGRWLRFLHRMSTLAQRVTFCMGSIGVRNNIRGRLDQLVQAIQVERLAM